MHDAFDRAVRIVADRIGELLRPMLQLGRIGDEAMVKPAVALALSAEGERALDIREWVIEALAEVKDDVAVRRMIELAVEFADLRPFVRLIGGTEWLLAFLVVGVGAPLSEELLFRGFLQSALAGSRLGFFGASLVTSALWTALHAGYSLAGILEVFLIGLFFSWLLWRTGSLRVAIFCHAFYNSLIVLVLRHVPLPG